MNQLLLLCNCIGEIPLCKTWTPSLQALGPYSVSKTALLGLTRALAPELAQSNIRVNCVAPGVIKTRFSSAVRGQTHGSCMFKCISAVRFDRCILFFCPSYGKMKTLWMSSKGSSALKGDIHTGACVHTSKLIISVIFNTVYSSVTPELETQRKLEG